MTVDELKIEADKLGYRLIKKPPPKEPRLQCPCGARKVERWYQLREVQYVCPRCGRETDFYPTEKELTQAWNKAIMEETNGDSMQSNN